MADDDMTVQIPLTADEKRLLEDKARECGKSLPDWMQEKLVASIGNDDYRAAANSDYQALLSEVRALKSLLTEMLAKQSEGKPAWRM